MRDTKYATELAAADVGGNRIERLFVKAHGEEEIRFSWWKDGRMQTRPLDLPERELLHLLGQAIDRRVFSEAFLRDLQATLATRSTEPPDDQVEDDLCEMANLSERDTNISGTILVSTALGSNGPRVKWYQGTPGPRLPCLIMSIGPEPHVRDDVLPPAVSRPIVPLLRSWVASNAPALLDFWGNGESWDRHRVAVFLDALIPSQH